MHSDPAFLLDKTGIEIPLIGFYDAPATGPFKPLISPTPNRHTCIFVFYKEWLQGKTLHITKDNYGCGGAGSWLCNGTTRSHDDYIKFLVDDEGLKSSYELMDQWLDYQKGYRQTYPNIMIGPLLPGQYEYVKTITFFVNPDQLSMLMIGAQYNSSPDDPLPVITPFGSGCMLLASLFEDLSVPRAIIGATDMAMRQYLPPDLLAFTVTKPMFEQLCRLNARSFLNKSFIRRLKKARGKID